MVSVRRERAHAVTPPERQSIFFRKWPHVFFIAAARWVATHGRTHRQQLAAAEHRGAQFHLYAVVRLGASTRSSTAASARAGARAVGCSRS